MALAPPAADRKRVKVYELKSNDWFDRGTGFCTGQVLNVSCSPIARHFLAVLVVMRDMARDNGALGLRS